MKLRWKIVTVAAGALILGLLLFARAGNREQRALEETRRELQRQGFKVDLSEFNFSTLPEERTREAALSGFRQTRGYVLMTPVASNAAIVLWKEDQVPEVGGQQGLPSLRTTMAESGEALDGACAAALSGPIRYNLEASHGSGMMIRNVPESANFMQLLSLRAIVLLRDGHRPEAWTNLLAATRLMTAWQVEPVEVSQLSRCMRSKVAFDAAWQLLQGRCWSDEQLAALQREWESVDFFAGLPEAAAFSRASMAAACQTERRQPPGLGLTLKDLLRSPGYAWRMLKDAWQRSQYRRHGTFEEERDLLLYYRNREVELRQALQTRTWSTMRGLPGITNFVPFRSKYPSRLQSMMNTRQLSLGFMRRGRSAPSAAAEAEARRRLVVTALALERYRLAHDAYPKTLAELTPEFLKAAAVDFMDGQALRYRITDDGHFVLYSVGLDCVDDGGDMMPPAAGPGLPVSMLATAEGPDLVWPRAATVQEAANWPQNSGAQGPGWGGGEEMFFRHRPAMPGR